jgi:tetratricopeptide (TPR) repeat protein
LEGIGRYTEAAELLKAGGEPSTNPDRLRFYRRIASLWWRSGQAEQAAQVLAEIARIDADCTEPLEWLAALHTNDQAVVSRERAVLAQLEAARRYQQHGARLAAFEAELRAFEIDPGSVLATEQLAASLTKLGRREAAEDVWRECAKISNDRSLYSQLIEKALSRDEYDRALAAGLDALDDSVVDVDSANRACEYALNPVGTVPKSFDGILARANLFGWLAARHEIALVENKSLLLAGPWIVLTRLFASAMGRPEWAVDALSRGVLCDPKSAESRRMLEASVAGADDDNLLLRALINAARVAGTTESQLWLANEFVRLQKKGLDAPGPITWALRVKRRESFSGSIDLNTVASWNARKAAEDEQWQNLLRESLGMPRAERIQVLARVAAAMALDPNSVDDLRDVLLKWLEVDPLSTTAAAQLAQLVDVVALRNDADEPAAAWKTAFELLAKKGGERGCLAVTAYWLRKGRPDAALSTIRLAIEKLEPSQRLLGWVVTLARRMVDKRLFADALTLMARTTDSSVGAIVLALAAETYLELGDVDVARRVVDGALVVSPNSARLVNVDVALQDPNDPRSLAETLERALSIIPPRAHFAIQLADAHEKLGNLELSLAWAIRANTLRPAATSLLSRVARLAILANDAARMTDWLIRSIDVPLAVSVWLPTAATVLSALISVDAPRAAETTRRLICATGTSDPQWRTTLIASADSVSDSRLALDVLERAVAANAETADSLREIVRRRLLLGDLESAFEASFRALRVGVAAAIVRGWVPNLTDVESFEVPDTELAAAELERELCRADGNQGAAVQAVRRLAADRFVLANDETEANALWSELLQSEDSEIVELVSEDLAKNLGHRGATRILLDTSERATTPQRRGRLLVATAQLAVQMGETELARKYIGHAITVDPSNVGALFVAESLLETEDDQNWLDELYYNVARSTLGSYGERALHYRAAKVFELSGGFSRALQHACAALEAVPSESTTLRLAAALARKVGDASQFVNAILTIVRRSQFEQQTARWLNLAQTALEDRPDFLPARVELLLQSLASDPTAALLAQTTDAVLQLAAFSVKGAENVLARLRNVIHEALDKIEGPSGARLALSAADASVQLQESELCAYSLACAIRCDAAIDEYEQAEVTINWLCTQPERARELLFEVLKVLEQPYVNLGIGALKAVGYLQLSVGDSVSLARLDELVARIGESESFLEWMADLLERSAKDSSRSVLVARQLVQLRIAQNRIDDAIQLLQSVINGHARTATAYDSAIQGVALLLKHESLTDAQHWVQLIRESLTPVNAASIELELARMTGETLHLVQALAHRAYSDPSSPTEGVKFLVEATDLADRLGHQEAALDCARSAVKWDPKHIEAQLKLAALIYKSKKQDTYANPEETLDTLRLLPTQLNGEDEELRSFLLAEALEAARGPGSGTDELVRAHAKVGLRPLIALGLGERLAYAGDAARALPMFENAIAGDLRGLRTLASVCIDGARVALALGHTEISLDWLQRALAEPACPPSASALLEQVQLEASKRDQMRIAESHARSSSPEITIGEPTVLAGDVEETAQVEAAPVSPDEEGLEIPLVRRRSEQPATPSQSVIAVDQAMISPETDPGSLEEAIDRASFMVEHASPSYQTLTLLRRWLRQWPSSHRLMEYVRDAASVERDIPLARAIEHARGILLRGAERVEPPDLAAQPIVPEAVRSLLLRDISTSVSDALALIWEGGEHLLQRELTDYGVTGLDRITSSSANPLGQVFAEISPRLGLMRTPLFYKRGSQSARATVALSMPSALLIDGELPKELRELAGLVAGSLWVTQPEYSFVMGASTPQVKTVLSALQLAFGPPQRHPPTNMSEALRLAEKLWESIPSAAQRRLRDLCLESLDYDRALEFTKRARRRAELYATGDLGWSIAQLSLDEGRDILSTITEAETGESAPNLADLLRLATSAEYAAIRWQPSRGSERRILALQR